MLLTAAVATVVSLSAINQQKKVTDLAIEVHNSTREREAKRDAATGELYTALMHRFDRLVSYYVNK